MSAETAFDAFARQTDTELRRAYAGHLQADVVPAAVNEALAYAWENQKRVRRLANPTGYLYRVGQSRIRQRKHGFLAWSTDADEPDIEPALPAALAGLPKSQAAAVWLVKACSWTNIQAAEALDIDPSMVATHVDGGVERLGHGLGDGHDLDAQLRLLAEHRLGQVPRRSPDALDSSTPDELAPVPADRGRRGRWTRAVGVAGLLLVVGAVGAWIVTSVGGSDGVDVDGGGGMHGRPLSERDDWTGPLTNRAQPGTFALAEVGTAEPLLVAQADRAQAPFIPASTFKLLNALIILETETIAEIDTVVPWDGVTREIDAWNQDHSLRTALQESAVWVFQALARQVGPEAMAAHVEGAEYGNADTAGQIDSFWLEGPLRTSAVDQLAFLETLALGQLPFDELHQGQVVASMPRLDGPDTSIAYKTGTALTAETPVAWLVGIVNTATTQWVFAYNVDIPIVNGEPQPPSVEERLAVVVELLESAGVMS